MNDRFKFRIWESYANEMKYIDDLYYFEERGMHTLCDFLPDVIPMQCTGLKDKNGKLIFEGDIVKQGDIKYVVNWLEGTFCFLELETSHIFTIEYVMPSKQEVMPSKQEVIGNIYENKELLEDTECQK